jgi:hypothetical protein
MSFYNYHNTNVTPKHKTFISFHHADDYYKKHLETQWGEQFDGFVSRSVGDGDINLYLPTDRIRQLIRDDFISDATVTLVLVGQGTWRRKHVDWEIASGIRDTKNNSRTGLLGLLLPTYSVQLPYGMSASVLKYAENGSGYNPYTIPPRLNDNIECGFAKIYAWPTSPNNLRQWIHDAFQRRKTCLPTNGQDSFSNNRTEAQTHWRD